MMGAKNMAYVLGIDLGTSSLKGTLVDNDGKVRAIASSEYALSHPKAGHSEQDPKAWIKACSEVLGQLKQQVADFTTGLAGISFSGQMHSLVLLDENFEVLRPAILWNDVRTTAQCEMIMQTYGPELQQITGNIALEGFTLPKILWVKEHEPQIWEQTRHILLPKDYLRWWLTGNLAMDFSDAAGTLLLDLEHKQWSKAVLEHFEIPETIMPPLVRSSEATGNLREAVKQEFGFKNDVMTFAGGADNACAALGAGILKDDVGMVSIGTSGVFLRAQPKFVDHQGKLHFFTHAVDDHYYSMGVTLAAGHSLNWFRDTFAPDKSFAELLANVGKIAIGAEGLLFTPYLVGERTPYFDSQIRGSFIGIDARHTLDHFARAVLEGITFSLKNSQCLLDPKHELQRLVSVGGGAKNAVWLQMQADIFNMPVTTLEVEQGPGLGAAMLAATGLGWYADLDECVDNFVAYGDTIMPTPENVDKYQRIYEVYRKIYPQTRMLCGEI